MQSLAPFISMDYSKNPVFLILIWIITASTVFAADNIKKRDLTTSSHENITPTRTHLKPLFMDNSISSITTSTFDEGVTSVDSLMTVKGNSKVISNGDIMPEEQDSTEFGMHDIDTGRVTKTYWILYESTNPASHLQITGNIISSDPSFTITKQPDKTKILPGDSVSFEITFDPVIVGEIIATITIPNNISREKAYLFAVAGVGLGIIEIGVKGNHQKIANMDFAPSVLDSTYFGEADVTGERITKTYWIFNEGKANLYIGTITSSDGAFTISQPFETLILQGDSVSFTITFDPHLPGPVTAYITIPNNDTDEYPNHPYMFAVSGIGIATIEIVVKGNDQKITNMDFAPSALDSTYFGEADVTTEKITRTYWILNEGKENLKTGTIISDNDAFTIKQPSDPIILPGDSVSFKVTFDPKVSGPAIALIMIPNNDTDESPNNPYLFTVTAVGTDQGQIIVKGNQQTIINGDDTPSVADYTHFGRVSIHAGSITKTYWIFNKGTADLHLTDLIESSNSVFTVTQPVHLNTGTPLTLLPGDSISFMITYDPSTLGTDTATIYIPNDDPADSPYTFKVAGKGSGVIEIMVKGNNHLIENGDNIPTVSDHTNFGTAFTNSEGKTHTFWIINKGSDTLNITEAITSNQDGFAIDQPSDTMLFPGDSVSFRITFQPTAAGTLTATITIPNDDVSKNPYTFAVSGKGIVYFNGVPIAVDDAYTMNMNSQLSGHVLTDHGADTLSHDTPHTVSLVTDVSSGALDLYDDGSFTYKPVENTWGNIQFTYQLCDKDHDCDEATVTIHIEGAGILIYNAFSPDDDGINDTWEIDNIENYPSNKIVIFNRWGNKVWEAKHYDNQTILWKGKSNSGLRVGSDLPDGTYFYIIEVEGLSPQQGYVVISRKQ